MSSSNIVLRKRKSISPPPSLFAKHKDVPKIILRLEAQGSSSAQDRRVAPIFLSSAKKSSQPAVPENVSTSAERHFAEMDIGHAVGKSLSQLETRQFLTSPWIPSKSFDFPVQVAANGKKRSFDRDWFQDYHWIVDSAKFYGAF